MCAAWRKKSERNEIVCFYRTQSDILLCGIARFSRGNKNKLRTFQPQKWKKIKNSQLQTKFTGSYKKKSVKSRAHSFATDSGLYWIASWHLLETNLYTKDVNWTYMKRIKDAQDFFWTSYVRSIYVLCPGEILWIKYENWKTNEYQKVSYNENNYSATFQQPNIYHVTVTLVTLIHE